MTPERENAMAALRAWAAPGARARLLEQAWRAGETNIAALADAAGVTRPTVYADLESRGVNPRTDRQETPTMQTITVGPFTGTETEQEREVRLRAIMEKHQQAVADGRRSAEEGAAEWSDEMRAELWQFEAARHHNTLLPFAQREAEAREAVQRSLNRVESAWAALRTARAWHAAHHVYVEAVQDARQTVTAWRDAAEATRQQHEQSHRQMFHKEAYAAYVPEQQRIRVDVDAPTLALVELEETHARRRAIAAETLHLAEGDRA